VWSDSKEYMIMNKVMKTSLPFEDSWSSEEKALAIKKFVNFLQDSIWKSHETGDRSNSLIRDLLDVRYDKFLGVLVPSMNFDFCSHDER
jgi:hypothetical protein